MQIRRAKINDLHAIKHLLQQYAKCDIEPYHLNKRDIALVAYADSGELIGFVWAGLMAGNKVAYVDKVAVAPGYTGKGVCQALYKEAIKLGAKVGVKEVQGIIRRDQYHDKSAMNALKCAFGADELPYTFVYTDLNKIQKELGGL